MLLSFPDYQTGPPSRIKQAISEAWLPGGGKPSPSAVMGGGRAPPLTKHCYLGGGGGGRGENFFPTWLAPLDAGAFFFFFPLSPEARENRPPKYPEEKKRDGKRRGGVYRTGQSFRVSLWFSA